MSDGKFKWGHKTEALAVRLYTFISFIIQSLSWPIYVLVVHLYIKIVNVLTNSDGTLRKIQNCYYHLICMRVSLLFSIVYIMLPSWYFCECMLHYEVVHCYSPGLFLQKHLVTFWDTISYMAVLISWIFDNHLYEISSN